MSQTDPNQSLAADEAQQLLIDLRESLATAAEDIGPRFLDIMPLSYFQDTPHEERLTHLRAILAARASGRLPSLDLRDGENRITFIRPNDHPGLLAEVVGQLPHDRPLISAKIHSANDASLAIDTFEFGEKPRFDISDPEQTACMERAVGFAAENHPEITEDEVRDFIQRCTADYVFSVSPLRFCQHLKIFRELSGTEGTIVRLEQEKDERYSRIVVAVMNASTRRMLERVAERLAMDGIDIFRAYLDSIDDGDNGQITLLGFVVQREQGVLVEDSALWRVIRRDLQRNKWVDTAALKLSYTHAGLGQRHAEVLDAVIELAHQKLVKVNRWAYSRVRLRRWTSENIELCQKIADLLLARFDPDNPLPEPDFTLRLADVREEVERVDFQDTRIAIQAMLDAVLAVRRTNVFLDERYGLAFRIDPGYLHHEDRPAVPFGVFFVRGRNFAGFHVRFRDIARGGLRIIRTRTEEVHARESERLYDEAFNLAFAQQLKNKDIPEGGAKAAVLADPYARHNRVVKAFADSLLDLITPEPHTKERIVDHLGHDELLYLGPDENILPEHIVWMAKRAVRRGYPLASAFISSKPGAGINHKDYGVTSEGVNVFLHGSLPAIGIDPDVDSFTVKMTGGPDGDVGGNFIRIAKDTYGDRIKIIGIADGSGSGEDPQGLDLQELLRLFEAELPIAQFDQSKLSSEGRIVTLDDPDGPVLRNTLHNRLVADAFVPCGGRPAAMNESNWDDFLTPTGTPSSQLIVEGANLFLTPEARDQLSKKGVLILKDSSANKCGVITSSYEICSNMLVSEQDFMPIKDRFVGEVIPRLHQFARAEVQLLHRLHKHHPDWTLPDISIHMSRVMMRVADAIEIGLDQIEQIAPQAVRRLVTDHIPEVLQELAGDKLWDDLPSAYLRWLKAKALAARIVYREGTDAVESLPSEHLPAFAIEFLAIDDETRKLARTIEESDLPDRDRVADLLRKAGLASAMGADHKFTG